MTHRHHRAPCRCQLAMAGHQLLGTDSMGVWCHATGCISNSPTVLFNRIKHFWSVGCSCNMDIFGGVQFIVQCKTPSTFKSDQIKKIIGGSRSRTWQSNVFRNCMLFLVRASAQPFHLWLLARFRCRRVASQSWGSCYPTNFETYFKFQWGHLFWRKEKGNGWDISDLPLHPLAISMLPPSQVQLRIQLSPSVHLHLGCEVKNAPHSTKILLYI